MTFYFAQKSSKHCRTIPTQTELGVHNQISRSIGNKAVKGSQILGLGAGKHALSERLLDTGDRSTSADKDVKNLKSKETSGTVYAEAIASGKPVIATRCGGPEFIVNDGNGLLVNIGDAPMLAQAMQTLAANWAQYSPQTIRLDFEQRFSRQAVVRQLRILYDQVLRK